MKKGFRITIYFVALLLLMAGAWAVFHEKPVHDLPAMLKSGKLYVVTDSSRMGFRLEGDSVYGFQYEIVKTFADQLGLTLVITPENNFETCLKGLTNGDYDIYAGFIPVTTEWMNDIAFSDPLNTSRLVLVQKNFPDSLKRLMKNSQQDLAGDTIFVPKMSPHKLRLRHLSDEIADTIHIVEVPNVNLEQLVEWVAQGKIRQTVCDEREARFLKLTYPQIDISLPLGFDQHYAWMVDKESKLLLQQLNDFLKDFIGSSAYWNIYRKYY
ncbi:MAG TPA: transporter substrate-binding domain-containing protein [Paludibacteraceae bacterium]|nr:transporter substrate-binding domain-containing protein [Paludibacteraceae bacterium]